MAHMFILGGKKGDIVADYQLANRSFVTPTSWATAAKWLQVAGDLYHDAPSDVMKLLQHLSIYLVISGTTLMFRVTLILWLSIACRRVIH
jgi:hypothetical protein